MRGDSYYTVIEATFAEGGDAEAAVADLLGTGIPRSSIELKHNVLPEPREREARFLWRILVLIILWSIAGAVLGASFGFLLAQTIGPEGSAGLIIQLLSWIIVGHLVGGMLAGYFVLADRTQREMPPDRPLTLLTVRGLSGAEIKRVQQLLNSRRPARVATRRSHTSE